MTTLMAASKEGLKSLLIKVKEESEKAGLKLNFWNTKIMAFGSISSWQTDMETVKDFIFLGSKITADSDCRHEIKRCLLLGRKAMTNLVSVLKTRDITLPTNISMVQAMVLPVVRYGCESWTIKKAEHWKIDVFELEKTLESPLDCKEIKPVNTKENQPWIFIRRTHAEAEALILLPCDLKSWLIGKYPDAGKDSGQEEEGQRREGWMASLTQWM